MLLVELATQTRPWFSLIVGRRGQKSLVCISLVYDPSTETHPSLYFMPLLTPPSWLKTTSHAKKHPTEHKFRFRPIDAVVSTGARGRRERGIGNDLGRESPRLMFPKPSTPAHIHTPSLTSISHDCSKISPEESAEQRRHGAHYSEGGDNDRIVFGIVDVVVVHRGHHVVGDHLFCRCRCC